MSIIKPFSSSLEPSSNNSLRQARIKQQLINRLYKDGQLSINDLSQAVKLSVPTIAKAVDELIEQQLVIKSGMGSSSGGRRPGLYSINPSSRYVMAIDLERSFIRMGLFDCANNPASKIYVFNEGLDTLPEVFMFITQKVDELLTDIKISKEKILGIGVSLPGLIDIHTGLSHTYLTDKKPVASNLTELTGIKTYVEHDTKLMAWGEQAFGLAKGHNNVLCLNVGSGIGLSMILNGNIYKGQSGYSGEFGHIPIDNNGDLCHCGKRGCIETMAAGKSLINKANQQILAGRKTLLNGNTATKHSRLTTSSIIDAARAGDQLSIELLNQAGEALGRGMSVLIHLFNPELIIIGGELAKAGDLLINPIEKNLKVYTIERIRNDARILISHLGEDARIMGSLALVMNKIFS